MASDGLQTLGAVTARGGLESLAEAGRYGRFGSAEKFAAETFARYQRYTDEADERVLKLEANGKLRIPEGISRETVLGQRTDAFARTRMSIWLRREGVSEGAGQVVQLNRWLRDSSGSGAYRIPDVRIPDAGLIMDGTIGFKSVSAPQIQDFYRYSGGDSVIIVRPMDRGGSYSLLLKR